MSLQGATNFRDLGGYIGQGGRPVRWRRLFRSDHLGALTAEDTAVLQQHGLQRVFDFRGVQERQAAPCALPQAQVHSLAIEPSLFARMMARHEAGETLDVPIALQAMDATYRDFVLANTPRYRTLFEHLLADDAPLVFHCTAGKDRTGLAAALILHALGVSRDEVLHDYLLTNQHLKTRHATAPGVPEEVLRVLNFVREDFLNAAFAAIDDSHGSLETYLHQGLGLGPEQRARLVRMYLED